jgi:adenosylcobinamide-phosphate synthase
MPGHAWILVAAILLDAAIGDPRFFWRRVPHPVAVIGALISLLEQSLNRDRLPRWFRRALGAAAILIVALLSAAVGYALELILAAIPYGSVGSVVVVAVLLAGRSLYDHVSAVEKSFTSGLEAARKAVAMVVGRDPGSLDESHICRAAIETTAENFSDGVIAPALWYLVLGLPGLLAYKAINTADSMIGHKSPRLADFGWASARLDDLVNLPASRLSGVLIAIVAPITGTPIRQAWHVMWRDASKHRSPNAGWPEAAMAAVLGIALAGPRRYHGVLVDDPFMNGGGRLDARPGDIRRGLRVYVAASVIFLISAAAVALLASQFQ